MTLRMTAPLLSEPILALVNDAYNNVYAHLMSVGDGLIPSGAFRFSTPVLTFSVGNANNHQMTWGILASALWGLKDFMTHVDIYACAHIWIFDRIHMVGTGRISILEHPDT